MNHEQYKQEVEIFDRELDCHLPTREKIEDTFINLGIPKEYLKEEFFEYINKLYLQGLFGTRMALLVEELGEFAGSFMKEKSKMEQAKELADVLFALHGTTDTMNLPLEGENGAMIIVAKKNARKYEDKANIKRSITGKIIKQEDM